MAMLIRHTRLNVTSIYPRINPAYVELSCEPAPAKPVGWHSFPVHRGEPVGYPATAGARRLVLYWEPAPSIPGIFWSTNEYRHDILQQPEPAGGYNRTTNNCECIDCSILVFLDCFLSVL